MATETKTTKKATAKAVKPAEKAAAPKKAPAKAAEAKKTTTVKSEAVVVSEKKPVAEKVSAAVSVNVVGIDGKADGKLSLSGVMFGSKVNKVLLAQAVRVYLANQRQGNASTKTRGEVDGSTRKIYRQKGTGRARHGSVRAPIFVKGGIVFGPKPRDFGLTMPKKMKKRALFSALSAKVQATELTVVSGLSGLEPKTKGFVEMLKKLSVYDKKQKLLFVTTAEASKAQRAGKNVVGVSFIEAKQLNPYVILQTKQLIISKEAVAEMEKHFLGEAK
jgi:large subunit ribosomal protein L4